MESRKEDVSNSYSVSGDPERREGGREGERVGERERERER